MRIITFDSVPQRTPDYPGYAWVTIIWHSVKNWRVLYEQTSNVELAANADAEGLTWLRGIHSETSSEIQAALTALTLHYT